MRVDGINIDQVEELTTEVVQQLQSVLNAIRATTETTATAAVRPLFSSLISDTAGRTNNTSTVKEEEKEGRLKILLRIDGLAIKTVKECCQKVHFALDAIRMLPVVATDDVDAGTLSSWLPLSITDIDSYYNGDDNPNLVLAHGLILPLLHALGRCYHVLDNNHAHVPPIPAAPPHTAPTSTTTTKKNMKKDHDQYHHQPRRRLPPAAAVGMLSLHAYTDIAVLIEVCVCTAILPYLEPNILVSVEIRAQRLPKALMGRLSPNRLVSLCQTLLCADHYTRRCTDNNNIRNHHHALQYVTIVLGNLLLLDRFRPMLLPRHVCDVHAAIFQVEEQHNTSTLLDSDSETSCIRRVLHREFEVIRSRLLPSCSSGSFSIGDERRSRNAADVLAAGAATTSTRNCEAKHQCHLSSLLLARSYQTLLLHGNKSPIWLRHRVTPLLNQLATNDLAALIAVFVGGTSTSSSSSSHPSADSAAAAVRLAHAILSPPSSSTTTATATTSNDLMEEDGAAACHCHNRHQAFLAAVCVEAISLLDELEIHMRDSGSSTAAGRELSQSSWSILQTIWALFNLLPNEILSEHLIEPSRCTRRWSTLLSMLPPPFVNSSKWMRILFTASPVDHWNAIDRFMHMAACPSSTLTSSSVVVLDSPERKEDAIHVLRIMIGYAYRRNKIRISSRSVHLPDVFAIVLLNSIGRVTKCQSDVHGCMSAMDMDTDRIVNEIDARANVFVKDVVLAVLDRNSNENSSVGENPVHSVVSTMLLLLLDMYLRGFNDPPWRHFSCPLLPLVMLPRICEEIPVHVLLNRDGMTTSLFELMNIVFVRAAHRTTRDVNSRSVIDCTTTERSGSSFDTLRNDLLNVFIAVVGRPASLSNTYLNVFKTDSAIADDTMLFSICSLLLSVLTSILELGAHKRSTDDEAVLQGFRPLLEPLTLPSNSSLSEIPVELASMATHTIALLVAREMTKADADALDSPLRSVREVDMFAQIKKDLISAEVPIRARAVVSLRRLASSFGTPDPSSQELRDEEKLNTVLSLLTEALNDSDSYVYLAAIYTVTVLADMQPRWILPVLERAVSSGFILAITNIKLSDEQRIKLVEALILYVRQKSAIYEYLPIFLDGMIVGERRTSVYKASKDKSNYIQDATHAYFVNQSIISHDDLPEDHDRTRNEEAWEEMNTRIRTGGPLFDMEESEVVRAALISVVTELVMVADPAVLSRYCHMLVRCCLEHIQLELSRPMRRAGATLARELYSALIREHSLLYKEESSSSPQSLSEHSIPFTVAMIEANEEALAASLQRALDHDDLSDLGCSDTKQRFIDPATSARCHEALSLRSEAVDGGMIAAGQSIVASISTLKKRCSIFRRLREPSRDIHERLSSCDANRLVVELD